MTKIIIDIAEIIILLIFMHIFTNLYSQYNRYVVVGTFSMIMTIILLPTMVLSTSNIHLILTLFLFSIVCIYLNAKDKVERMKRKINVYKAQNNQKTNQLANQLNKKRSKKQNKKQSKK